MNLRAHWDKVRRIWDKQPANHDEIVLGDFLQDFYAIFIIFWPLEKQPSVFSYASADLLCFSGSGGLERLHCARERHAHFKRRIFLATGGPHGPESMASLDVALAIDFLVHLAISH
jgi:hypothetical protein